MLCLLVMPLQSSLPTRPPTHLAMPAQVVLSHTPYRELVPELGEVPVLIAGRGHVQDVARRYGFQRTITTRQLVRLHPDMVPFAHNLGRWGCGRRRGRF